MAAALRLFCLCLVLLCSPVQALTLDESPLDAAQEAQAEALFGELRCAVCQGQSIRDSNAQLAVDLRQAVRLHLSQGKSPEAVKALLVESYGPDILLQEPVSPRTLPLWLLVGFVGCFVLLVAIRPFLLRKARDAA